MSSPRCGKCHCCKHQHHHKHPSQQTRFRSKSQPADPVTTPMSTPQRLQQFDYDSNHDMQATQRANLLSLLRDEKFCDLKCVVGPQKTVFQANRIFLASISKTFEQLLYPTEEAHIPYEVHFPDVLESAFESVLHFAYCNDPRIDAENVLALKYLCERFEIGTLSAICNEFWQQTLNPENICCGLNQAVLISSAEFVRECQQRIAKFAVNATVMIDSPGFKHMNLKAMIVFLQTDGLRVAEHRLWQSILSWADHQCSHREAGAMLNHSQSFSTQTRAHSHKARNGVNTQSRSKSMSISKHISVEFELLRDDNDTGNDDDLKESELETTQSTHTPMADIAEEVETNAFHVVTVQTAPVQRSPEQEEGSEVYDTDGNRTGGDSYLEAMASDNEEVDYNIVVTQPLEQVDGDHDGTHTPWTMNVVQPKDRNALLRCVKRYIRWGAMSGKYFVQHVIPEMIFDKDELVTILASFQCPDLGCGEYLTEPRWNPQGTPLAMQRGAIDLAKWTYPGGKRMDAICFQTNSTAILTAIGVFDCKSQCSAQFKVYRDENGKHNSLQVVAESAEQVFKNGESATNVALQLPLKEPLLLERNERYTIELLQQNEENEISYQIKDGQSEIIDEDTNFSVTFSKAAVSKNGTNVTKGAIPTLYFKLNI